MNADRQVCGRRLADEQADLVVEVFRMLSDSTRVQLLWALADRELAVNDLAGRVGKAGTVGVTTSGQAADGAAGEHPA
jgi:DNA-binding transcriptional ArsR family regulator